jgi:hypothetical protein
MGIEYQNNLIKSENESKNQKFFLEYNNKIIKLENNLNIKSYEEIFYYLKKILLDIDLELNNRYVIEGSMGDYIIWENNKIMLIGECS